MWRDTIAQFISERLQAKLDKLKDDDPKRVELLEQYQVETWINNAARRVMQIQAVTHSLKPIHPDARGSNLYVEPSGLPPLAELGSHALGDHFESDVVAMLRHWTFTSCSSWKLAVAVCSRRCWRGMPMRWLRCTPIRRKPKRWATPSCR